jgi:dTDP-4-amino-4,6-dideoxygalactose transaminase
LLDIVLSRLLFAADIRLAAVTRVQFLDLHAAVEEIEAETEEAIRRVLESGRYSLGSEVEAFEQEFATFCGVRRCVGVGNGLDALQPLLRGSILSSVTEDVIRSSTPF